MLNSMNLRFSFCLAQGHGCFWSNLIPRILTPSWAKKEFNREAWTVWTQYSSSRSIFLDYRDGRHLSSIARRGLPAQQVPSKSCNQAITWRRLPVSLSLIRWWTNSLTSTHLSRLVLQLVPKPGLVQAKKDAYRNTTTPVRKEKAYRISRESGANTIIMPVAEVAEATMTWVA